MTHLYRFFESRCYYTANVYTIIDDRKPVQHRAVSLAALLDTCLCLVVTIETGIAIDRRRQKVCLALLFEVLQ